MGSRHLMAGEFIDAKGMLHSHNSIAPCPVCFPGWMPPDGATAFPSSSAPTVPREVEEALRRFLVIADDVQRAADERTSRARRAQEAAALSRAGRVAEGREAMRRLDASPVVWDFSRTVNDLAEAAQHARAALRLLGAGSSMVRTDRVVPEACDVGQRAPHDSGTTAEPPPNVRVRCRRCGATWTTGGDAIAFRCPGCGASVAGPALDVLGGADGKEE